MDQTNQQKEIAAALKKKNAEASAKAELDNLAALVAGADRKAAAKAWKIKTTTRATTKASAASQAAVSPCKQATKRQNPCLDSEDDGTIISQGN